MLGKWRKLLWEEVVWLLCAEIEQNVRRWWLEAEMETEPRRGERETGPEAAAQSQEGGSVRRWSEGGGWRCERQV